MVIKKIKSKKDIFYFAHRGANKLYPENSLESFQKSIELGIKQSRTFSRNVFVGNKTYEKIRFVSI